MTTTERLELFAPLPDFRLPSADGKAVDTKDYRGVDALLVAFIDNASPSCRRVHSALGKLAWEYRRRGVAMLVVNLSAGRASEESAAAMRLTARDAGWSMPYLMDRGQSVARGFGVRCVPDFFVFDRDRRLAYHGRFDGTLPEDPADGDDLREALEAILAHEAPVLGRPSAGAPIPRPEKATETESRESPEPAAP
jgi:peroxiredoxin